MLSKCGADVEEEDCPYCRVCKETGIHIWSDNCEDAWGVKPSCNICGIDRPELTDEERARELN